MAWEVEVTDEFLEWYTALPLEEARAVFRVVGYLEERGPRLSFPFSSDVRGSRHGNMRERVEAIKAIWANDEAEYHGKHVDFDPIWQWPKPLDGKVPVYVGGNGPRVEDRVLRYGDGWMPNMKQIETLGPRIEALRERAGRHVPVTYYGATLENLEVLENAGVDRALIVLESGPAPSIPSLG